MSEQARIANLEEMVERLIQENELLRDGRDNRSRNSSAEPLPTPSVTGGDPGPSATAKGKQPIRPPAPAEPISPETPATEAERFLEALRPLLEQTPKDRGKRLPTKGPETFDGTFISFRSWWEKLQDYVEMNSPSLPTDRLKIQIVGTFLKGKAWVWYQTRRRTMEASHERDDWTAFSSAMEERFTDRMERRKEYKRMIGLKYEGDIQTYLATLQEMNSRVGIGGEPLRAIIAKAITPEMHRAIYQKYKGLPDNDTDLIEAVREIGIVEEEIILSAIELYEEKGKEDPKDSKGTGGKNTKDPGSKGPKAKTEPAPKGEKNQKRLSWRELRQLPKAWNTAEDALKDVDPKQVDKFKESKKDCWRCGYDGHRSINCRCRFDRDRNRLPDPPAKLPSEPTPVPTNKKAAAGVKRSYTPPPEEEDSDKEPAEKKHETSAAARTLGDIWAHDESEEEEADRSDF